MTLNQHIITSKHRFPFPKDYKLIIIFGKPFNLKISRWRFHHVSAVVTLITNQSMKL